MTNGYGTYCPVSLATEVLGERWTILVVLALLGDVKRFSELQRALPRISPSTLSQRLRSLEDAGILEKKRERNGDGAEYLLTQAGRDLEPIVMEIGEWGQRWARDMVADDLDIRSLGWSIHGRMNAAAMPTGRTVLEFDLTGEGARSGTFWIVHDGERADVCVKHPGHPVDLRVMSELRRFTEVWRGFRSLDEEVAAGRIRLHGPRELCRAFPKWLLFSKVAHVERERPGHDRTISRRMKRGRA